LENLSNDFAMPKLIFTSEPFAGRVYELTLEKTTGGRGDLNTLALGDSSVSLAHCEILVHGPEVIVRDLGSANGTFVSGMQLKRRQ
jgi:pSer/pThr/pTyr-binding forkhead associated (FHA) protein